jgi:hypothetical protein
MRTCEEEEEEEEEDDDDAGRKGRKGTTRCGARGQECWREGGMEGGMGAGEGEGEAGWFGIGARAPWVAGAKAARRASTLPPRRGTPFRGSSGKGFHEPGGWPTWGLGASAGRMAHLGPWTSAGVLGAPV